LLLGAFLGRETFCDVGSDGLQTDLMIWWNVLCWRIKYPWSMKYPVEIVNSKGRIGEWTYSCGVEALVIMWNGEAFFVPSCTYVAF
jgi:hypothetical protein